MGCANTLQGMYGKGTRKGTPFSYDGTLGTDSCMGGASPCGRPVTNQTSVFSLIVHLMRGWYTACIPSSFSKRNYTTKR